MPGIILVDVTVFSQKNTYISYVFLVKPSIYFYTQMAITVNTYRAKIGTSFLLTTAFSVPV